MSDTTVTTEAPPMGNADSARNPDGSLRDQSHPTPTSSPEPTPPTTSKESTTPEPEGKTLLTKPEPTGAPEKYTDFTLPEGVKLDGDQLKSAQDLFKGLNLSQDAAQKLVDFHTSQMKALSEAPANEYTKLREKWQADTKADPEIGSRLPQVKETVSRALDTLGDAKLVAEFRQTMDLTGAGDHPAFIKTFYKLAQSVVEGRHVAGGQPSKFGQLAPGTSERPSVAKALYPNNP